jgi:hypothetical protein
MPRLSSLLAAVTVVGIAGLCAGQASADSYGTTRPMSPVVGQPTTVSQPRTATPASYPQYAPATQPVDPQQPPRKPVRIWLFTGFF